MESVKKTRVRRSPDEIEKAKKLKEERKAKRTPEQQKALDEKMLNLRLKKQEKKGAKVEPIKEFEDIKKIDIKA